MPFTSISGHFIGYTCAKEGCFNMMVLRHA
jgi:hypothetical protein